jgi:hypothetical protein
MRRNTHQIEIERLHIDRYFTDRLRRVAVDKRTDSMRTPCNLGEGLDHANLIVDQHH